MRKGKREKREKRKRRGERVSNRVRDKGRESKTNRWRKREI